MAQYPILRKSFLGTPTAAVGTVTAALPVRKGTRILFATIMPLVKGIGGDTIAIRVNSTGGGSANGIYSVTDPANWTVGTPINCVGTDLATGGFLVTADSTIDVAYVGTSDSTAMQYRLTVGIVKELVS